MSLIGQKITVLGAGVAGLAVARALALRGAQVVVLEQAAAVAEVGAGLQVSPNGAVVLDALGLGDALKAVALRAQAVDLRDGVSGNLVTRLDVARLAPIQGYHFVHRADLIEILRQGAVEAGVELRLNARVLSVSLTGAVPIVELQSGAQEAGLLIGADGLHSATRAALNGAEVPFFTHQVAWRALIAGDGGPDVAEVHMGAGRHLVSYPLRRGALRNIVAVLAEAGARPDHIVRLTWYVTSKAEYLAALVSLGVAYKDIIGRHYPAMALVQVVALVENRAKVEIEATAVIPVEGA